MSKMEVRPTIKLVLTPADKTFEIIGWLLMVAFWVLIVSSYSSLPETIPIHYNGAGKANGFGGKAFILLVPIVATLLFIGLTVLNKFPHVFNYPVVITQDNAADQYSNATRLVRYFKIIVVCILGLLSFKTVQYAMGAKDFIGIWFLPLSMGLMFIPLIPIIISSLRQKKRL